MGWVIRGQLLELIDFVNGSIFGVRSRGIFDHFQLYYFNFGPHCGCCYQIKFNSLLSFFYAVHYLMMKQIPNLSIKIKVSAEST